VRRLLGFEVLRCGLDGAEVRLPVRADFLQEKGLVQGGILTTLADACAVYPLIEGLAEGTTVSGVELSLSFLRPARLGAGELVARSRVIRRGRRLAVCHVVVEQGGVEVARGLFTYLFHEAG